MGLKLAKRHFDDVEEHMSFRCPGCFKVHSLPTKGEKAWKFNGSMEAPTFQPSILAKGVDNITEEEHKRIMAGEKIEPRPMVCHSYVTDGKIQFLSDCTHHLTDKTVELADIPEKWK